MVYISSQALAASPRQAVLQAQSDLSKIQTELSSGKLADIGLGLGSGSGQLISLTQQSDRLQAITDSNTLATTRLSATASALAPLQTAASSFMASLVAAQSSGSSSSLQATAQSNLASMISALNTSVSGQYLFGGVNTGVQPVMAYTQSPPSSTKQAVDAAFSAAFGTSQSSASAALISGTAMQSFLDGPFASLFAASTFSGTWSQASSQPMTSQISGTETIDTSVSANASAFRELAQAYTMVSEFGGQNFGSDAGKAVIASASQMVSSALADLTNVQTGVGIAQSSISGANDRMATQISLFSSQANAMTGVDSYALTTQLSSLQTQIQASYEMTSKLQQLSLVNYMP